MMEAECIALLTAARAVIPLLQTAKDASQHQIVEPVKAPVIKCKMFEDNQGAAEIANVPKM